MTNIETWIIAIKSLSSIVTFFIFLYYGIRLCIAVSDCSGNEEVLERLSGTVFWGLLCAIIS